MKLEEFASKVVKAYEEGKGIFSNKVNAEDWVPQTASDLNKALFLFYVIQLDYATKSQRLYAGARGLFGKAGPQAFYPRNIRGFSDEELTTRLEKYLKPRYINEAVKRWKDNSKALLDRYGGDPRLVFKESESGKEALSKIREFRGFGPKIGNFFVRSMVNTFGYEFEDVEEILPPVDVWDVRIAYLLGYLDSDSMSESNVQKTKRLWSGACQKAGVSWLTFDKALWLLGSEGKPRTKRDLEKLLTFKS